MSRTQSEGLLRAKIIENQNLHGANRFENFHFRGFARRVVTRLNFLQQFPVVAKQSRVPALNQFFQRGNSKMRFSDARRSDEQQSFFGRAGIVATNPWVSSFACFNDCACCAVHVFPSVRSVT